MSFGATEEMVRVAEVAIEDNYSGIKSRMGEEVDEIGRVSPVKNKKGRNSDHGEFLRRSVVRGILRRSHNVCLYYSKEVPVIFDL